MLSGVETCASVWACPVCAGRIFARRAEEIEHAAAWWTRKPAHRLAHLTLTVRHAAQDDARALIRGVAAAWRLVWQGRDGLALKRALGLEHYVRALEITRGPHGWHPHVHALLFVVGEPSPDAWERLRSRWRSCVVRALGDRHLPSWSRGTRHRAIHHGRDLARYLAKLSLELTGATTKEAREAAHHSPWQIATIAAGRADALTMTELDARRLWIEYVQATKGARAHVWSRGLKRAAGIAELTDAAIARGEHDGPGVLLLAVPGVVWTRAVTACPDLVTEIAAIVAEERHAPERLRALFGAWLPARAPP